MVVSLSEIDMTWGRWKIKSQYFTFTHVNSDDRTANWTCLLDVEYRNLEFKEAVWAYSVVVEWKKCALFLSPFGLLFIFLVNTPNINSLSISLWNSLVLAKETKIRDFFFFSLSIKSIKSKDISNYKKCVSLIYISQTLFHLKPISHVWWMKTTPIFHLLMYKLTCYFFACN